MAAGVLFPDVRTCLATKKYSVGVRPEARHRQLAGWRRDGLDAPDRMDLIPAVHGVEHPGAGDAHLLALSRRRQPLLVARDDLDVQHAVLVLVVPFVQEVLVLRR